MTDRTYLGKNGLNELTGKWENPNVTKGHLNDYEKRLHNKGGAMDLLENIYNLARRGGVRGVPSGEKTLFGRITCLASTALALGAGVHCAAAHMENATDMDYVGDNIIITIRGNGSDESPDPYDCLFADDGNLSKIGPALALAAMVAESESKKMLRAEKEAAKIINLGGEYKPPIDVSEFNPDWSEVIEWNGKLHWPDSSMGRAEEGKMYIPKLIPLTDAEETYYINIYDGPKKPRDDRIFDGEIAIK